MWGLGWFGRMWEGLIGKRTQLRADELSLRVLALALFRGGQVET